MTKRLIQLELAARHTQGFAREICRFNSMAAQTARAQHERHYSPLAAAYRRVPKESKQ
jgi:hypothetical protein